MIKVIGFKKLKSDKKKYKITFEKKGKTYIRKFGAAGMSDFTIHKDRERRERYISRHKKDLRTNDPMKPGYLSMYILWNKPSLKASLADYKRRLGVYNKTGKFPKGITGSKKLNKFGAPIQFDETTLNVLPGDVQNMIQREVSAADIQRIQRGKNVRKIPKNMMTKKFLKQLLWNMNANYESPEYANETMKPGGEPWIVLNPTKLETSQWLFYAAEILTADDFDNKNLWYKCLYHIVDLFVDEDFDNRIQYLTQKVIKNLTVSAENIEEILEKIGYSIDTDDDGWYHDALRWLNGKKPATGNAFGKKYNTPDNVVNKKLYASIKAKIKRSIKGRRWGAYDSGRLVREYKAKGGKYRGSKGKTDLSRWYKEKWIDACAWPKRKPCGRKTKERIAYCRPSKRVDSKTPKLVQKLTKTQIKSRCVKKKKSPMKRVTKFGNKRNIDFYKQLMKTSDDPMEVTKRLKKQLRLRCGKPGNNRCNNYLTELFLNIFHTVKKELPKTEIRNQIINMIKPIEDKFRRLTGYTFTKLSIKKSDYPKLRVLLGLMQDEVLDYTEDVAHLASADLVYIS